MDEQSNGRDGVPSREAWLNARGGRSELRELIRAHDWASTPVGPAAAWPHSLKALIKTMMASRYPMILTWGPQLIQFYNDGYSKLIGDKHPAALGEDIRVTMAEAWDTLGPVIHAVMETGVASWLPALLLLLERSGYREESYFDVSHAPAEDDSGAVVGMLAVCTEVTQQVLGARRLRLLRDLATHEGETRGLERTCQEVVSAIATHPLDVPFALLYLRSADGRRLTLSAAVGLPEGTSVRASVDLEHAGEALPPLVRAARGEAVTVDDVQRLAPIRGGPWGDPVHAARVLPLASSGQGAPLGVLVAGVSPNRALDEGYSSFHDLLAGQVSVALRNARAYEEERQRAEALAELDRAKTAFFSNVSHEFRTPLTLMLGPVEDLLAPGRLAAPERKELELVHRNAVRLLRLVNTLLDFSRLEAGRLEASVAPTDLATLTADLASGFRSATERAGLVLTVDCPPLSQPVYVDREHWEKVVLNLLSNALKFTFEGGITVRLREEAGAAVLTVEDTGTGIPESALPGLFERFYRVKGARGRTHEGSGIGLSLVRELVRLHGGEVAVASREEEGTTFTVTLPLGRAHLPDGRIGAERTRESTGLGAGAFVEEALRWLPDRGEGGTRGKAGAREQEGPAEARRGRVLAVDDNADMREYLSRVLGTVFEVVTAEDGEAALEAVRQRGPFDLVLTDVMMPRLGGFGLLKALREAPRTRALPVIMLSARAGEEASVEGLEAGADDYLVKPFSARELLARTRSAMELARMRGEVARFEVEESHLRQAIRARDDFLSVASHELKTPLTAFRLQLELIERNLSPEARTHVGNRILSAGRQVSRLSALVESLLDVSQLSTGRLVLNRDAVDLAALVADAVARLRDEAVAAGSTLSLHLEAPLMGRFDRLRLDQVVTNLLQNALKYGAGTPIEVRVERGPDAAHVSVKDGGMGIAPEDQERIFGRFERAVSARKYGGLGLGLWIARQVVEAHGGTICVHSEPGRGATFTVALPLEESRGDRALQERQPVGNSRR